MHEDQRYEHTTIHFLWLPNFPTKHFVRFDQVSGDIPPSGAIV